MSVIVLCRLVMSDLADTQMEGISDILNMYASANKKVRCTFLEIMTVAEPSTWLVVIAKDFNCITDKEDRISSGQKKGSDRSFRLLRQLVCDHSQVDAGKEAQGTNFTQVDLLGQAKSCVDFVFLPKGWTVAKAESVLVCFSDTCLLQ